jgi:hypothetical protein
VSSGSWCDKLASIPTAGFRFNHHYISVDRILQGWHSILDRNSDDLLPKFTLTKHDEFNCDVNCEDGFKYGADANRVNVAFNHRLKVRNISAGGPVVEMLSTAQPFTKLLPIVFERLVDATLLLPEIGDRKLQRAGVASTTPVDEPDLPPGIAELIAHVGKPWKGLTAGFTLQFTTKITETKFWTDRCIHTLVRPEVGDDLMSISFDFQRTYDEPRRADRATLTGVAAELQPAAMAYFETLAEGKMFNVADSKDD